MYQDPPLITIGFTCFNAETSIAKAIHSAQQQTYSNIEILVADDGSSDLSVQTIESLMQDDSRIRLIRHETNKGTAQARSTLAQNARGEFLAFFDDDDTSMPSRIEKQYQRIISYESLHPKQELVFCYCDRNVAKEGSADIDHVGHGIGRMSPEPKGESVANFILWRTDMRYPENHNMGQMGSGTMMARTTCFQKLGYFDSKFRRSAEIDLAVRAALEGAHFISVPEPLITQNKTLTQDKSGKKPLEYALLLRKKHKHYLQKQKAYLGSIMTAFATFYGSRGKTWKARTMLALACLLSPQKILINRLSMLLKSQKPC